MRDAPADDLVRRRRDELVRRAGRAVDAVDLFRQTSARLARIVPFDAAAWAHTDPATGLPTGPTYIENLEDLSASQCSEHWRREFVDDDVHTFRDLARADRPAGALATGDADPERSARYRNFVRPLGFGDEMRVVLRVGGSPWGAVTLWRAAGRPAFSPAEVDLVAGLSDPIGEALRAHSRPGPADGGGAGANDPGRPGLLLFALDGRLLSIDEAATAWLGELPPDGGLPSDLGVAVPLWMLVTVFHAGAAAQGRSDGTARTRVRTRRGTWLVCHASCLRSADGEAGTVAVVVEPATPADVAPIVVEAYDLTDRERQIAALVARGSGTDVIAAALHISPHTVRDHVKAIFRKTAVSSRGELVAKLFAEHYEPGHMRGVVVRSRPAGAG